MAYFLSLFDIEPLAFRVQPNAFVADGAELLLAVRLAATLGRTCAEKRLFPSGGALHPQQRHNAYLSVA